MTWGAASGVAEVMTAAAVSASITMSNELMFAALDVTGGYKSPYEVGKSLAVSAATSVLGAAAGGAGAAAGSLNGIGGVALKTGITASNATMTQATNAFIMSGGDFESVRRSFNSFEDWASIGGNVVSSLVSESLNASLTAEQKKLYSGLTTLSVSAAGKAAEYTMYAADSFANGGGFASAYDNMGGLTVNIANLGAMLDIVSCGIARNNSTGQSSLGKYAEALKGTGLLEVTFGSSGITGRIGTGGIDLGGSLYDFGKRMNDVNSLKKYEAEFGTEKGQAAYNAYIYGDWTVENTAARLASKRDELIFTAGTDYKARTTQNTAGTGRIIEMNNLGDKYNNAITLGHEAYRNGIVDNNNKKETLDAVLSHVKMADAMKDDMKKAGIGFDKQLAIEVTLYNMGVLDIEKLAEDYDSSADYWKLMSNGQLVKDKDGWLKDENGLYINADGTHTKERKANTIGAEKIQTGLLNILYGEIDENGRMKNYGKKYNDFTWAQQISSVMIMENAKIEKYYPDPHKLGFDNVQWVTDGTNELNMNQVMNYAGGTIATEVFMNYFDKATNNMLDNVSAVRKTIKQYKNSDYFERLNNYYEAKRIFYEGNHNLFLSSDLDRLRISGEFGPDDYYTDNQHKGGDFASKTSDETKDRTRLVDFKTEDISVYAFYSGKVTGEKFNDS